MSDDGDELPEGWALTTIGELATGVRNGISQRPDDDGTEPILRISAVRPRSLDLTDVRALRPANE